MSKISFNEFGEPSIYLDEYSTQELEESGYCQVNEDYFVIKVDHCYFVTKTIEFGNLQLNCKN